MSSNSRERAKKWSILGKWIRIERVARKYSKSISLVIAALFVAVRLSFWVAWCESPFVNFHEWTDSDMNYFDDWSTRVSKGDLLSSTITIPIHSWRISTAKEAFELYPGLKDEITQRAQARQRLPEVQLWEEWIGDGRFYQEPLYAYLVAMIYSVTEKSLPIVFLVQMCISGATIWLVFKFTRLYSGYACGFLAAIMGTLFGPLLLCDALLLRESLITFCSLVSSYCLCYAMRQPTVSRWGIAGFAAGVMVLAKTVLLPVSLLAGAYLLWHRSLHKQLLAYVCLFVLAISPVVLRNAILGLPLSPVPSQSGMALSIAFGSTVPQYGWSHDPRELASMMQTTQGNTGKTVREILHRFGVTRLFEAMWNRARWSIYWYEAPDNVNVHWFREQFSALACCVVTFPMIFCLAIAGVCLNYGRKMFGLSLFGPIVMHFVVLIAVFMIGRYRVPLAIALLPLAAFGLLRLAIGLWDKDLRRTGSILGLTLILLIMTCWPLPKDMDAIRPVDYSIPLVLLHDDLNTAINRRDLLTAEEVVTEILTFAPESSSVPPLPPSSNDPSEVNAWRTQSQLWGILSRIYIETSRPQLAEQAKSRQLSWSQAKFIE